jgi:hypothetical protein
VQSQSGGVSGIADDFKGYLFRGIRGKTKVLTGDPLAQSNVYRMIRRREMPLYDRRDDEVAVDEVARLLI